MSKSRRIVWTIDKVVNAAVAVFLFLVLLLGCYCFWDAKVVHASATATRWQAYKPTEKNVMGYDELVSRNPDVSGWVTVYGTGIDYPVMYHPETSHYFFRDPLGKNSASGSIFMDGNCSRDFSDYNTILYGHHMDAHTMFGDVPEFANAKYFDSHLYGNLFYGGRNYGLQIFGLVKTDAYNFDIYRTKVIDRSGYLATLHNASKQWRDVGPSDRILLMSTCSGQETDGRSVLVAAIRDNTYENTFGDPVDTGPGIETLTGLFGFPWIGWFTALILIVVLIIFILWRIDKKRKKHISHNNA